MATSHFSSFERVFPARDFYRGKVRSAVLWSCCASVTLILLLLDLYLVSDLLQHRGKLELQP